MQPWLVATHTWLSAGCMPGWSSPTPCWTNTELVVVEPAAGPGAQVKLSHLPTTEGGLFMPLAAGAMPALVATPRPCDPSGVLLDAVVAPAAPAEVLETSELLPLALKQLELLLPGSIAICASADVKGNDELLLISLATAPLAAGLQRLYKLLACVSALGKANLLDSMSSFKLQAAGGIASSMAAEASTESEAAVCDTELGLRLMERPLSADK